MLTNRAISPTFSNCAASSIPHSRYAPDGAGATFNLTPDGDQITTPGQASARLKFAGQELTAGRQLVRTAYINPNDFRMIPLTFEGIVLLPEDKQ